MKYRAVVCLGCGKLNEVVDVPRVTEADVECVQLRAKIARLEKMLEDEQTAHVTCHALMERMAETLRCAGIDELVGNADATDIN